MKSILVTGGSGSIGKELVIQLLERGNYVISLDRNEEKSFYLQQEIPEEYLDMFTARLGDVTNSESLKRVFEEFEIDEVYHTAANKHVPLGEENPQEFVRNNLQGTINLIYFTTKYRVKTFVFISTDKAVEPISVMGQTKRLCELYIQNIQNRYNTKFIVCRFGNIIGSSGSVYEIFEKQAKTGTITVTHPDMERYFIPVQDAVTYLIRMSYLKQGLYTFKMGSLIKINDVAKEYAKKYNCKIEYTGLRPGERLSEKLFHSFEMSEHSSVQDVYEIISDYTTENVLDIYLFAWNISEEPLEVLKKLRELTK